MSEINYIEIAERVKKLTNKIGNAMEGEDAGVCLNALSIMVAMMLVSFSKKASLKTECGAKVFYEDLLRKTKELEQRMANNEKAN